MVWWLPHNNEEFLKSPHIRIAHCICSLNPLLPPCNLNIFATNLFSVYTCSLQLCLLQADGVRSQSLNAAYTCSIFNGEVPKSRTENRN